MILGILQARMSSTRLPGKVLAPILGRPMLELQLERLARVQRIERLVVATSSAPADDAVAALCARLHVECARGSLDDVLDRFYRVAAPLEPEYVVRLTADCPLADPALIDAIIAFCVADACDYASNTLERSYPVGLDAEVMRFGVLADAWREAAEPYEREHVTPFIYRRSDGRYKLGNYREPGPDRSALRWTVDYPEDLAFVRRVYEALYPGNPRFDTVAILQWMAAQSALPELPGQPGK